MEQTPYLRRLEDLTAEELCAYAKYKKLQESHLATAHKEQQIADKLEEKMLQVLVGEKTDE